MISNDVSATLLLVAILLLTTFFALLTAVVVGIPGSHYIVSVTRFLLPNVTLAWRPARGSTCDDSRGRLPMREVADACHTREPSSYDSATQTEDALEYSRATVVLESASSPSGDANRLTTRADDNDQEIEIHGHPLVEHRFMVKNASRGVESDVSRSESVARLPTQSGDSLSFLDFFPSRRGEVRSTSSSSDLADGPSSHTGFLALSSSPSSVDYHSAAITSDIDQCVQVFPATDEEVVFRGCPPSAGSDSWSEALVWKTASRRTPPAEDSNCEWPETRAQRVKVHEEVSERRKNILEIDVTPFTARNLVPSQKNPSWTTETTIAARTEMSTPSELGTTRVDDSGISTSEVNELSLGVEHSEMCSEVSSVEEVLAGGELDSNEADGMPSYDSFSHLDSLSLEQDPQTPSDDQTRQPLSTSHLKQTQRHSGLFLGSPEVEENISDSLKESGNLSRDSNKDKLDNLFQKLTRTTDTGIHGVGTDVEESQISQLLQKDTRDMENTRMKNSEFKDSHASYADDDEELCKILEQSGHADDEIRVIRSDKESQPADAPGESSNECVQNASQEYREENAVQVHEDTGHKQCTDSSAQTHFPYVPSISSELETIANRNESHLQVSSENRRSARNESNTNRSQLTEMRLNARENYATVCDKHLGSFNFGMNALSPLCDQCANSVLPYVAVLQNLLDNMMTSVIGKVPETSQQQCLWCLRESSATWSPSHNVKTSESGSKPHVQHHGGYQHGASDGKQHNHHHHLPSVGGSPSCHHGGHQHGTSDGKQHIHHPPGVEGSPPCHHVCHHQDCNKHPGYTESGSQQEETCPHCHPQDNQHQQHDANPSAFHVGKPGEHTHEIPERWSGEPPNEQTSQQDGHWEQKEGSIAGDQGIQQVHSGNADEKLLTRWHDSSGSGHPKQDAQRRVSVGDGPKHLTSEGRRRSWAASSGNASEFVAAPGSLATTPTFPSEQSGRRGRQSLSRSSSTDKLLSYVQGHLPSPEEPKVDNEAYVTIATNNSTALGCLVLGNSLRLSGTNRALVAVITDGVSAPMRHLLASMFHLVQSVRSLDAQGTTKLSLLEQPDLGVSFVKLHIWRLVQYTKCVFLDSSALVIQNSDALFERDELSAVPDIGWPDCFNTNVFVYKPSLQTFWGLIDFAEAKGSFDGGDHGLLNMYFRNWMGDMSRRLPFIYNLAANVSYTYTPAFQHFGRNVKIVHFMGSYKPWNVPFHSATCQMSPSASVHPTFAQFVQYWLDIFGRRVLPLFSEVIQCHAFSQKYITAQELLLFLPAPTVPGSIEALPTPPSFRKYPETDIKLSIPIARNDPSEPQRKLSVTQSNAKENGVGSFGDPNKDLVTSPASVTNKEHSSEVRHKGEATVFKSEAPSSIGSKDTGKAKEVVDGKSVEDLKETDIPGSDVGDFRGMAAWEQGNADYLGQHRSDNILRRLDFLIGKQS